MSDYLIHYGRSKEDGAPKGSGRYPKGSGERPNQHDAFSKYVSPKYEKELIKKAEKYAILEAKQATAIDSGGLNAQEKHDYELLKEEFDGVEMLLKDMLTPKNANSDQKEYASDVARGLMNSHIHNQISESVKEERQKIIDDSFRKANVNRGFKIISFLNASGAANSNLEQFRQWHFNEQMRLFNENVMQNMQDQMHFQQIMMPMMGMM